MLFRNWFNFQEKVALKGDYKGSIFQRLVAGMYVLAPSISEDAEPAFADLKKKIARQDEFLRSKFNFKPTTDDPYPSTKVMTQDIENQKRAGLKPTIPVYAEPPAMQQGQGHPLLSNDDNVKQRGVHDVIAHYYGQHPFSARGEYAAYNRHLKTLCNNQQLKAGNCLAAKAMFSEVVAQTSYYYVYKQYAEQKAVILHDFDHLNIGFLAPDSKLNRYFYVEGKSLLKRPDFNWKALCIDYPRLSQELLRQSQGNPSLQPIAPQEEV